MDINQNSIDMLEHVRQAINCCFNNGKGSREQVLEIRPGDIKVSKSEFNGVEYKTTDEIIIIRSWDPTPVKLNVTMTSVSHSMKTIMDWAIRDCF